MSCYFLCDYCGHAKQLDVFSADCDKYGVTAKRIISDDQRPCTPEQAIAATLGGGDCYNLVDETDWFECSECGVETSVEWCGSGYDVPRYCPNCGRKVKR